jgi:nitrate reductase gamma subunit
MLDAWIAVAQGPLLRLSLIVMGLGLARIALLQVADLVLAWRQAGDQAVAWRLPLTRTLAWLVPVRALRPRDRTAYSIASVTFHVAMLALPLFAPGHVALWRRWTGLSLPALPAALAEALTLGALVALAWMLGARALTAQRRRLSHAQDWLLPLLFLVCVLAGWMSAHPASSPIDARLAYLVHVMTANVVLLLVPFSKLQHIVLFWTSQTASELGWRFSPGAGARVRASLGKPAHGL